MLYRKYDLTVAISKLTNSLRTAFAAAILFAGLLPTAIDAKADVVTDWNEIADIVVVTNANRPAGAALIDMAYVHAAIYDAVVAIDRRYEPYAVSIEKTSRNTSTDAAVATAAQWVLRTLFADQNSFIENKYHEYLTSIPEGEAKTNGIELGRAVSARLMELRADDGRDGHATFTQGSGPGAWRPTSITEPQPITPWIARMRPFMIKSASQFRAPGPSALTSEEWARDYRETALLGGIESKVRTPEQTEIARFYAEHSGAQYNRIARDFVASQHLKTTDRARLFAMIYLSIADSLIANWDSKYHFGFWRPVTAIRAGGSDGNDLTEADPIWTPLVPTPGHPEYPAAHGSLTASFAETLRTFYRTKRVNITLSSTVTNTTRSFSNTDDLIHEIIDARVYGGMHYRTSGVHGAAIGKKVVKWMNQHYFRRAR